MKKTKAHCNRCLGERNHEIMYNYEYNWVRDDEGVPIDGTEQYDLIKCLGCGRIALRHTSWFSLDSDERGKPIPRISYYPPSISRRKPAWFGEVILETNIIYIKKLLGEIYIGLQNGAIRLATMGIRALIEFVMIHNVGDNGSFFKNLDEFYKQGHISKGQKDILNAVLEAGHATIHRSYSPSEDDLSICIDIAESIIETIYIHPSKAAELSKKIPKGSVR